MFLIVPNLLEFNMCSFLIDAYQKNSNFALKWRNYYPLLTKPSEEISNIFCSFYNNYIERMEIVKWPENSYMEKHFDVSQVGGKSSGLTSITYLNDDYEGGQTCIVDENYALIQK